MSFTSKSDELEFPNSTFDVSILTNKTNNDLVCVCFFKRFVTISKLKYPNY